MIRDRFPIPEKMNPEHEEVLTALEEALGETVTRVETYPQDGIYHLETETLQTLNLHIDSRRHFVAIQNIAVLQGGQGDGSRAIGALAEITEEIGYELRAEDVLPAKESWWRLQGFIPDTADSYSDYWVYQPRT